MVCCVSAPWLADCYSPAPLYKAEPQHSAAEKGVIPSNPLTMQMEKLLVNVSLFFSEVALIQIFGFLAHPMDGSLMLFFQCLRRATFLSWRGCYLHGKMLYVCSQSSSHRISQGSLTKKAILLNVSLRFLRNNIRSNRCLTTQMFNFQMFGYFPVLIQEGKKVAGTSSGL